MVAITGKTSNRIKELLKQGKYASQIAKELHISKQAVSKHIKAMGLTRSTLRTVFKEYLVDDKVDSAHIGNEALTLRLHRFKRSYPVSSNQAKLQDAKELKLNNNVQQIAKHYGATIRLTTQHLIVEGITLVSPLATVVPELLRQAEGISDSIAHATAEDNAIELKGSPTTSIYEVAITNHPEALEAGKLGETTYVPLYWNPQTKAVEIFTDYSLALGELEGTNAKKLEKLRVMTKEVVDENAWEINKLLMGQIIQQLGTQSAFFTKHNKLIDEIRRGLKAQRESPKPVSRQRQGQRRLFP